MIPQVTKMR